MFGAPGDARVEVLAVRRAALQALNTRPRPCLSPCAGSLPGKPGNLLEIAPFKKVNLHVQ